MQEKDSTNKTSASANEAADSGLDSSGLQSEQHRNAETGESERHHDYAEDETDRHLIAIGEWLADKAKDASLIDIVGIVTGFVLVIVGIVAACIYNGQLSVMQEQLGEMSKQYPEIQKSADAAKSAAETANNSLKFTRDSFRQDQRPYIALPSISTNPFGAIGVHEGKLRATFVIQNYGKTPAMAVHYYGRIAIGDDQIKRIRFDIPVDEEIGIVPPGIQPPIAIFSDSLPVPIDPNLLKHPIVLSQTIVIYGHIDYTDIFLAPNPRYTFVFCQTATGGESLKMNDACKGKNYIK